MIKEDSTCKPAISSAPSRHCGARLRSILLKQGIATVVSYASGNAGGIFAPSLYIGAMAGGAVGTVVRWVAPFPTGEPGAYAIVGMGTLFAGVIRAPMTSVFMIFEITQDYQILVPLMVANLLSFMISRRYQPTSVYHALLQQDDVHLPVGAADQSATMLAARELAGRSSDHPRARRSPARSRARSPCSDRRDLARAQPSARAPARGYHLDGQHRPLHS